MLRPSILARKLLESGECRFGSLWVLRLCDETQMICSYQFLASLYIARNTFEMLSHHFEPLARDEEWIEIVG